MGKKPYKRKVSNLLVDKRFQLKYTLMVVIVSLAIFAVLGTLYYGEMKASSRLLDINESLRHAAAGDAEADFLARMGEQAAGDAEYTADSLRALDAELSPEVESRDRRAVYYLLGAVGLLVLILAAAGIWLTHKMAGPLFALTHFMKAAREGRWDSIRPLRKGDEFVHLVREFEALAESIKERHRQELATLQEVLSAAPQALPDAARSKLETLAADKETFISR